MVPRIVIATPHKRYKALIERLRAHTEVLVIESREDLDPESVAAFQPEYVFFPHWSWKVPPAVYERFEAVIFHMADVPFGRGGSPLQNLVRRGFDQTVIAALKCVEEVDAGPVYLKHPLSLLGTAEEIFLRAARVMEKMIIEMLETRPKPVPQEGEPVTFRRLTPEDGDLTVASSLDQVFDMIRMLDADGYPPAFVDAGAYRFEFARASLRPDEVLADVIIRRRDDA